MAALPAVMLVAANPGDPVDYADLMLLTLATFVVAAVPVLLLRNKERVAAVVGVALLVFFSFQTVADLTGAANTPGQVLALFAWTGTAAVVLAPSLLFSRRRWFQVWVRLIAVALVAGPLVQIGFARSGSEIRAAELTSSSRPAQMPNVYYFMVDGYGRPDVLRRQLGDTGGADELVDTLEAWDFVVSSEATSNYGMTLLTIPTALNMAYPHVAGDRYDPESLARAFVGDNAVVARMQEWGYRYVYAPASYWGMPCGGIEDLCLNGPGRLSETGTAYAAMTPLKSWTHSLDGSRAAQSDPASILRRTASAGIDAPVFLFAHIMAPHPPYVRDSRCDELPAQEEQWRKGDEAKYLAAVACLNQQLLEAADAIVTSDPDAIVVIQADHGPGFELSLDTNDAPTQRGIEERFSILSALRLGRGCDAEVPEDLTPVNTFRIVFACVTEAPAKLVPNAWFFSTYAGRDVRTLDRP